MGYGNPDLSTTNKPKRTQGGKKKIIRSSHKRGATTATSHTRRLKNGKVILVRATRRRATSVSRHEKAGKGYGIREKRASGKIDYRRRERGKKDTKKKTGGR